MIGELNPALILMAGGLLLVALPSRMRAPAAVAVAVAGLLQLLRLDQGSYGQLQVLGLSLTTLRLDSLSFLWALIFHVAAVISVVYALHVRDRMEQVATLVYAGAGVGAVLAGDLLTLFVFWELTAVSSVFLVWASRTRAAYRAGMRYLAVQVLSGVLLMIGTLMHLERGLPLAFDHIGLDSPGGLLIFLAFGIKCAFPLLHNWLQDAYPRATVTGTVVLSVFTTKLAVYALARGYAGTDALIWIGATMTAFPIFFAVIENDLRRVLSYSLNNQLGFMVAGVGVGTELALNGTAAHAFAHILYKALLFMSMGAVLHRVGTIKASELGGLYKSMPRTAVFCIVGSLSISAFPLFSGFVSKSMILTAAAAEHHWIAWLVMLLASAGVMDHSGIKIPFFSFFAHDSGKRCAEAPPHMQLAMGTTAVLCLGIGIYPEMLYRILPFPVDYGPYTVTHVLTQLQLLLFSALAFTMLYRSGIYPAEIPSVNLDFDAVYRRLIPWMARPVIRAADSAQDAVRVRSTQGLRYVTSSLFRHAGPGGALSRNWYTGAMVFMVVGLLALLLLIELLRQ